VPVASAGKGRRDGVQRTWLRTTVCGRRCEWRTSREAPRGGEGPEVDHRSGGRLGGPKSRGTWDRPCDVRVEPMTAVNFYSVTVSADALSAQCRLVRQFDAQG
jgi:hypothetical protein